MSFTLMLDKALFYMRFKYNLQALINKGSDCFFVFPLYADI